MATACSTAATADIASSLTMEEIPIKLRCAACNKLAVNAFRLPCCEQSICENCQASLPEACPVCAHEPVKAELCKPNKALRTTIKVFIRTEEKKRETQKGKVQAEPIPQTPVVPVAVEGPVADGTLNSNGIKTGNAEDDVPNGPQKAGDTDLGPSPDIGGQASLEAQMDIPRPSVEVTTKDQQFDQSKESTAGPVTESGNSVADGNQMNTNSKSIGEEQQGMAAPEQQGLSVQLGIGQTPIQGQSFPGSFGFDGATNGFPSMGSYPQADFNQLMQFMPSGMSSNGLGYLPTMMGMSGMGMDPMAMSQGMYGGFGGQGMNMNGMNMGMGYGAGQVAYGGYNGQAATWNGGQDKFNPNAFGGLATGMDGDFGANAGYGGYNMPPHQGNYGQMHHQQYQHNNFQNGFNGQGYNQSGRGRGRGYGHSSRGRGGYGPAMQGNQGKHEKTYEAFHHQLPSQLLPQAVSDQGQPNPTHGSGGKGNEAATNELESATIQQELNPGGEGDGADVPTATAEEPVEPEGDVNVHTTAETPALDAGSEATHPAEDTKPAPIETVVSADREEPDTFPTQLDEDVTISPMTLMPPPSVPAAPLGPAALYRGDSSQDFAGRARGGPRGYFRGGPELRGGSRGRGGGFSANGTGPPSAVNGQPIPTTDFPRVVPVEPKGLGVEGAPKAPKALREGLPNTGLRGGRGFSIVGRASVAAQGRVNGSRRSRSASPSRNRSGSRSRSPSRRRSRHHRRHRHRSRSTSSYDSERERRRERRHRRSRKHDDEDDTLGREGKEEPLRHASVTSSSRQASHPNHQEKDREGRDSNKHRSSQRSHRDRSRSRSRSRDRDHRYRRKRSRSPSETPNGNTHENSAKDKIPPTSPSSSRRKEKDRERDDLSRKHRDRDYDRNRDEDHRDRKRSRRDRSASPHEGDSDRSHRHRSSRRNRHDDDGRGRDRNGPSRLHRDRDRDRDLDERKNKDQPPGKLPPAPASAPARSSHPVIPTGPKKLQPQTQAHQNASKQPERAKETENEKAKEKEKDPHTLEREARNRERLLKEQQRREAVLAEKAGGRRNGAGGGRRMSYKYEDEEGEESRAKRVRRVEAEREGGRWG